MKFLCDGMLVGLARYLRFLGQDVVVVENFSGDLRHAGRYRERFFLTTSRRHYLLWPFLDKYLVSSGQTEDQFRRICSLFPVFQEMAFLTRCSRCNEKIVSLDRADVCGKVPEKVFQSIQQFYHCPRCGRIYWEGGHVQRLKDKLKRMGVPLGG